MGKGASSQVVQYVPVQTGTGSTERSSAATVVTPAVARSIEADTQSAQLNQEQTRARMYGLAKTYNRYKGAPVDTTDKLGA